MRARRVIYRDLVGKPEGKRPLGRRRHRWKDNIKWIVRKWDMKLWTGSSWFRIEKVSGECGNDLSGSIQCGKFLD
jgi:hypothetical protein